MKPRQRELPEAIRVGVWNEYMDGASVSDIARYSYSLFLKAGLGHDECSPVEVRRVLSEPVPEEVMQDLRYVHRSRAFWISATGNLAGNPYPLSFVLVFQPWKITGQVFRRGVRSVCRDFRQLCPNGHISPQVIEGLEMDAALRFIAKQGTPAWIMDSEGCTRTYNGEFSAGVADVQEPPSPGP